MTTSNSTKTTNLNPDLKNYIVVTIAYWGLTITDGAIRMLVLLHFHTLGYTPIQIAFLFLFYEIFGVVTNLFGGWIGSQFGLRLTLYSGLGLQVFALFFLGWLDVSWAVWIQVAYVMFAQAISGIAKDLTKMSAKSAVRLVVPKNAESRLFKWVAILTGSKNTLKGVGFFVGATLLAAFGFRHALFLQAGILLLLCLTGLFLPEDLGKMKQKVPFTALFSKSKEINLLSAARFFLFGSRDVWFVVALPVFLYDRLDWSFMQVGAYMASWVIGYGMVQSFAPTILGQNKTENEAPQAKTIQIWTLVLSLIPGAIAIAFTLGAPAQITITLGLIIFGIVFAFNSAVHSYLVLAYTEDRDVALNVGFYYMANAGGRLVGSIASGVVFQLFGLVACLWVSSFFVLAAFLFSLQLTKLDFGDTLP